jgi:hypothetical protein
MQASCILVREIARQRAASCASTVIRRLRKLSAYVFAFGIEKVAEMATDTLEAIHALDVTIS